MKKIKSFFAISCVVFLFAGCASFGVWSKTAQTDISAFQTWADQWIGGALAEAPALIQQAGAIPGINPQIITNANAALTAASGALSALNALGTSAAANTAAVNEQAVVAAINNVNATVGAVKTVLAGKQPAAQ